MNKSSILVVDDELGIRSTIRDILTDEGYSVEMAADAREARTHYITDSPDLVLLDIWMPDTDGISLLKEWSDDNGLNCPVVVMSGHGTVETAVEATRLGAVDFIEKPLSLEQLLSTVETALMTSPLGVVPVADTSVSRGRIEIPLGKSALIQTVCEQAKKIAEHNAPVLIAGEAGSGRDLFGQYIHSQSDRARAPFVLVSGAALTDSNAIDQLIGHGGVNGYEQGYLRKAAGGTLFISDLQELGASAQSYLLGVVEQGVYTPPGKTQPEPCTARIMASVQRTASDGLRADLLAAMGVMQLSVPPLREYSEDIPELLRQYVHALVSDEGLPYRRFGVPVQNRLRNYPWPGNLRELKNLVRRLLLQDAAPEVSLRELEDALEPTVDGSEALIRQDILALPMREAREQFERIYLTQQLALCGGKVGKLAERVGMERTHLYRKLRALGVDFGQSTEL
jgi:DNA-binding NtrC family response regulator